MTQENLSRSINNSKIIVKIRVGLTTAIKIEDKVRLTHTILGKKSIKKDMEDKITFNKPTETMIDAIRIINPRGVLITQKNMVENKAAITENMKTIGRIPTQKEDDSKHKN